MLVKFFSTLSNLAKYVLDVYQFTSNVPAWFKKLVSHHVMSVILRWVLPTSPQVNLVGTELSQQVYLFITYIQVRSDKQRVPSLTDSIIQLA